MRHPVRNIRSLRSDPTKPIFPEGDAPVDRMERLAIQLAELAMELRAVTERLKEEHNAGRRGEVQRG